MAITRNHHAEYRHWQPEETKIIDGKPVRFCDVCVHTIRLGDVDDPDIWVADPIWKWQNSEAGQYIMEHAVEQPYWTQHIDTWNYGYMYKIMARLSEKDRIFWELKWGGNK